MAKMKQQGDGLLFEGADGKALVERQVKEPFAWRAYQWRPATKAEAKAMGWPDGHEHWAHITAPDGGLNFETEAAAVTAAGNFAGA